jgi:Ni/Co efflux regulator RcnB
MRHLELKHKQQDKKRVRERDREKARDRKEEKKIKRLIILKKVKNDKRYRKKERVDSWMKRMKFRVALYYYLVLCINIDIGGLQQSLHFGLIA